MTSAIEKQLVKATGLKQEEGQDNASYQQAMMEAVENMEDTEWGALPDTAKRWFNASTYCDENKLDLPAFDDKEQIDKINKLLKGSDKEGKKASAEEEEQTGPSEDEEMASQESAEEAEESEEKVESKAKANGAAKKKAAAKGKAPAKAGKKAAGAAKGKAKAAEAGRRGRKGQFELTDKIKSVAAENPFREGSKAAACYKAYKVGRTVQAVLDAGVPRSKLARHMKRGFVTLA